MKIPCIISNRSDYLSKLISGNQEIKLSFQLNKSMLLSEICFSGIHSSSQYTPAYHNVLKPLKGEIFITERHSASTFEHKILFKSAVGMDAIEKRIKLPKPIQIQANRYYSIIVQLDQSMCSSFTSGCNIDKLHLSEDIFLTVLNSPKYTLIDILYFENISNA